MKITAIGRRLARGEIAASTVLRIVAILIAVLASVLVARLGGPGAKGVASAFAAVATTSYALSSLGLPEQVVQVSSSTSANARRLLLGAWLTYTCAAVLLALAISPFQVDASLVVVGCLAYLIPTQAAVVALGFSGVRTQALGALLQPIALCLLALLFAADGSLTGSEAAIATALSYLAPISVFWRAVPREDAPISRRDVTALFRHGVKWQVPQLTLRLVQRSDILVVYLMLGPHRAGIYSVASQLSELSFMVPRQIGGQTYNRTVRGMPVSLKRTTITAMIAAAVSGAAIALVGGLAITTMYGSEFADARLILLALAPGPVLGSLAIVLAYYFRGTRDFRRSAWSSSISAAVSVALAVALVPLIGSVGAALASTIGWGVFTLAGLFTMRAGSPAPGNA